MGKIEDEFNRLNQSGRQTPTLLGGDGVKPAAPAPAPQAVMLNQPTTQLPVQPTGVDKLRFGAPASAAEAINERSVRAQLLNPPPARPSPSGSPPPPPVDPRPAFNTQPGQALAEGQARVQTARNLNAAPPAPAAEPAPGIANSARAAAMAPPQPAGPVTLDQKLGAADLRYGAKDTAYADAVKARAGGAAATAPPAGVPPAAAPAGTPSAYARFMEGASAQRGMVPPGGATIAKAAALAGKGAVAAGGLALPLLRRALPLVEPVIEAGRVVNVAADPESTKLDVATQAAEGVGRGAATIAGGMAGAQAGTLAAPFLGPLAPAGPIVGGIVGGAAGYFGGDQAIKALRGKVRSLFGLGDDSSPVERTDARNASIAAAANAAVTAKAKPPAAAAPAAPAGPVMTDDQADVYSLMQQTKHGQPTAPVASAPAGAAQGAPSAPDQQRLAQYQSLQQQQNDSPIARTVLGGGESAVYYKDGSRLALTAGQPMPDDVAAFHQRHAQLNALRSGATLPDTPAAAPAAPAGGKTYTADNGHVPFAFVADDAQRRNLQIFGQAVSGAEGHDYDTIVGGKQKISDFSKHPNIVGVTTKDGPSTAGGRYAITGSTWNEVAKKNGLNDFSPASQDQAFIALLERRGALDDVRNGNFDAAVAKLGNEWQGLPSGASKNQGKRSPQQFAKLLAQATQDADGRQPGAAGPLAQADMSDLRSQPVQVIKGMAQSVNVPNAAGYDELPKTIFDAAQRDPGGFGEGGVAANYLANINAGYDSHNNPAGAKLAEQALQNQGALNVANATGQYGVQGHKIATQGAKEIAATNAEGNRHVVVDVDTGQRDAMGQPIYKKQAIDTRTNQPIGAAPAKQAYPAVPEEAIAEIRKSKGNKVAMESFIKHFGVEQFNKYKDGK